MSWIDPLIDELAGRPCPGYGANDSPAGEPTALAAMALAAHGRVEPARESADFLAEIQNEDGSVGIRAEESAPGWPTGLAVLAWTAVDRESADATARYGAAIDRAVHWILEFRGETSPKSDLADHDTTLAAWPWVGGTHSWVEPTTLQLLALKATGYGDHPRAREAETLLLDRQLSCGGWNYGNTAVLGQLLRPHVQPTGMALLALAGDWDAADRCARSCDYLEQQPSSRMTALSLAWGIQGLAAHRGMPRNAESRLLNAHIRPGHIGPTAHRSALIVLAALGEESPLVRLSRKEPVA